MDLRVYSLFGIQKSVNKHSILKYSYVQIFFFLAMGGIKNFQFKQKKLSKQDLNRIQTNILTVLHFSEDFELQAFQCISINIDDDSIPHNEGRLGGGGPDHQNPSPGSASGATRSTTPGTTTLRTTTPQNN